MKKTSIVLLHLIGTDGSKSPESAYQSTPERLFAPDFATWQCDSSLGRCGFIYCLFSRRFLKPYAKSFQEHQKKRKYRSQLRKQDAVKQGAVKQGAVKLESPAPIHLSGVTLWRELAKVPRYPTPHILGPSGNFQRRAAR